MNKIVYQIRHVGGHVAWQRASDAPDDINMALMYISFCEMGRKPYEEMKKEYKLIVIQPNGKEEVIL